MMAARRNMTVSVEMLLRICCVVHISRDVGAPRSNSPRTIVFPECFADGKQPTQRAKSGQTGGIKPVGRWRLRPIRRLAKNKVVAVVPALPEPFAVLVLVHRGVELGNRQDP